MKKKKEINLQDICRCGSHKSDHGNDPDNCCCDKFVSILSVNLGKFEFTLRGFKVLEFKDDYGAQCSLQKSSIATKDCIWLGPDENANSRMHLDRGHAMALGKLLIKFAETGEL